MKAFLFLALITISLPQTVLSQKLAVVDVEVRDKHGNVVADLTKDNFIIYENGRIPILNSFTRIEYGDNNHPYTYFKITCYAEDKRRSDSSRKIRVVVRANDGTKLKVKIYKHKDLEVTL